MPGNAAGGSLQARPQGPAASAIIAKAPEKTGAEPVSLIWTASPRPERRAASQGLAPRPPPSTFPSCHFRTDTVPRHPPAPSSPETPVHAGDERPAPSKTQRKHEMHALQDLGLSLALLDPARLATLALPERLAEAITLLRRITKHEARRRQLQYVGRLMRDVDPVPLRMAISAWDQGSDLERARFAAVEGWRNRLLDDAEGLDAFIAAHPGAGRAALAALIGDAQAERLRGAPPRKFRALFREIKRIVETAPD